MGEYAEYALQSYYRRGTYERREGKAWRNPITARCPICGKGCRSLAGDLNAGLVSHMKDKHGLKYYEGGLVMTDKEQMLLYLDGQVGVLSGLIKDCEAGGNIVGLMNFKSRLEQVEQERRALIHEMATGPLFPPPAHTRPERQRLDPNHIGRNT